MDHPWLQAASNLYNTNIHILTTGVEIPRWTKLQPSSKLIKTANQPDVKDNIYLLHADNCHFDLLVPKPNPEALLLTDEEQDWMENQMNLSEKELTELDILSLELAESKKEIRILQDKVLELVSRDKVYKSDSRYVQETETEKETSGNNVCDSLVKTLQNISI